MKLTKIEKLNAKRTPGEWYRAASYEYMYPPRDPYGLVATTKYDDKKFIYDPYEHKTICSNKSCYPHSLKERDLNFIAAAPAMAEMLLKLKDFKPSIEFLDKICKEPSTAYCKELMEKVVEQLIKELEG